MRSALYTYIYMYIYKKEKQKRIGTETWRFREKDGAGEEGSTVSWLCAQRQENKPLKVIQLIHLDNTEASSYRPLPKLYTQTHTHFTPFLTGPLPPSPSSPPPPPAAAQLLSGCLKEREGWNEQEAEDRGGRSGGRKKGGSKGKNSWGSPRWRCSGMDSGCLRASAPPPPNHHQHHLTTTITSNLYDWWLH